MRPLIALALLATAAGCLRHAGPRVGREPLDRNCQLVERALREVTLPSFERHVRGDGWRMRFSTFGTSGGATDWHTDFCCLPDGEAEHGGKVFRLPPEQYERVLAPIRADVLAAVERTGVTVTDTGPVEFAGGAAPEAKFAIRYLRQDGEVAGEVAGRLAPADRDEPERRYTVLNVTLREWYCR
jgi:hypothetical protein